MPTYKYEALDKRGKTIRGTIDSPGEDVVVEKLREMGYYPLKVESAGRGALPDPVSLEDLTRTRDADERARASLQQAKDAFRKGDLEIADLTEAVERLLQQVSSTSPGVVASLRQHIEDLREVPDPQALRAQLNEEARLADERREKLQTQAALMRAGKPEGYAGDRMEYAPGWLQEPMGERFGVLCLGGNRDIVWVDQDPSTMRPTAVKSLCTWEDFQGIAKRGLFRRRAILRALGGQSWTIRLDPKRSSANVPRLARKSSASARVERRRRRMAVR